MSVGIIFYSYSWSVLRLNILRLTNTPIFYNNLVLKLCLASVEKYLPQFAPTLTMAADPSKVKELKLLFDRLQEAKKQADVLKTEMISIRKELEKAESQLFPNSFKLNCKTTSDQCDFDAPSTKKAKCDFSRDGDYVIVYTDGACENNGRWGAKAGIGVWFGDNHPLNASQPVKVQIARDNGIKKLQIITDSQFTINAMTKWIKAWKKNNWKLSSSNNPVKNKTDFQKLDKLCEGLDIKWTHVAGHSGIEGNECADRLAREGAKLYVE
ncbi:ribonuclease H1 isoform X2 [Tribolium madens]|uniref:ribonuclease H1 isoform X2 n=1 Tax=Tribolium madens TaxID=41895 RepID=UPI001CF7227F|nr:ribonuclease H1 isoform X2 [Tribolium madens]